MTPPNWIFLMLRTTYSKHLSTTPKNPKDPAAPVTANGVLKPKVGNRMKDMWIISQGCKDAEDSQHQVPSKQQPSEFERLSSGHPMLDPKNDHDVNTSWGQSGAPEVCDDLSSMLSVEVMFKLEHKRIFWMFVLCQIIPSCKVIKCLPTWQFQSYLYSIVGSCMSAYDINGGQFEESGSWTDIPRSANWWCYTESFLT